MTRTKIVTVVSALAIAIVAAGSALAIADGETSTPSAAAAWAPADAEAEAPATTTPRPRSTPHTGTAATTAPPPSPVPPAGDAEQSTPPAPPAPPAPPVREELPGAGDRPPATPSDPIGELDDEGPVPAGLDLAAPRRIAGTSNGFAGADDLAAGPSCSHQCITRGVAYPRGFGAELVVETSVPAELFLTVVADLDGDDSFETAYLETAPFGVTAHSWPLDHLAPAATYHVMAAATDEHGHTSYAWGEFTTLSERTVFVELGNAVVLGGPGNITHTRWELGLDGPLVDVTPGEQGILLYDGLPRRVDLEFWMFRRWDGDVCEVTPTPLPPQGAYLDSCVAWNSTSLSDVDLDTAPAGETRWTQTSVEVWLETPTSDGGALPAGYGDPYWFSFSLPMTLHVEYS